MGDSGEQSRNRKSRRVRRHNSSVGIIAIVALLAAACGGGEQAASPSAPTPQPAPAPVETDAEPFYAGKTIEIIVPSSPGGGSDTVGRVLAQLINQYVEGNPDVVVNNLPGGGTITGSNTFALGREPDGLSLVVFSTSSLGAWLLGNPDVQYDVASTRIVAGAPSNHVTVGRDTLGIQSAQQMAGVADQLIIGHQRPDGAGLISLLGFEVLGIRDRMNFIFGYEGAGATRVAFEQNEINLTMQSFGAYANRVVPLIAEGIAVPLFNNGRPDGTGSLGRDSALPDMPHIGEVATAWNGRAPAGEAWDALVAVQSIIPNQFLAMHGDAPDEAYRALTEGLRNARELPEFQAAVSDVLEGYPLLVGDEWDPLLRAAAEFTDAQRKWISDWLLREYNFSVG